MDNVKLLLLIVTANAVPVLLTTLLGRRFATPLDGGRKFLDGRPWFGKSKTLRGITGALLATLLVARLLHLPLAIGLLVAAGAMAGDLTSSFIKRRLNRPPSSQAIGLDQIPEALFPLLLVQSLMHLGALSIVFLTLVFMVLEMTLSPLLHKLHLRKTPYL